MTDREKVISRLENWRESCPFEKCAHCGAKGKCTNQIFDDVLALLREQDARVMTWDEMIAAGKEEKAVYVEECPKGDPVRCFWGIAFPGMELPKDVPFNYPGGVDFNVTDVDGDIWDGDFYNMNAPLGWRAWTAKPTPEQMRETKWEGDKE